MYARVEWQYINKTSNGKHIKSNYISETACANDFDFAGSDEEKNG